MPGLVAADTEKGKETTTSNSKTNMIAEKLFIMNIIALFSYFRNFPRMLNTECCTFRPRSPRKKIKKGGQGKARQLGLARIRASGSPTLQATAGAAEAR